jgi:hypothetical protein
VAFEELTAIEEANSLQQSLPDGCWLRWVRQDLSEDSKGS